MQHRSEVIEEASRSLSKLDPSLDQAELLELANDGYAQHIIPANQQLDRQAGGGVSFNNIVDFLCNRVGNMACNDVINSPFRYLINNIFLFSLDALF